MPYNITMTQAFESEKNKKAFIYTSIICAVLLLLFILIKWKVEPPTVPVIQDLIEINLGNNEEGFGDEQPLIKGNRTPAQETISASKDPESSNVPEEKITPDDNAPDDAAPIAKPVKITPKVKINTTTSTPTAATPKPQKPKITYTGPATGPPGNNTTDDNGYKSQGKNPSRTGDDGDPSGNKDAYGKNPGGRTGGPKVIGNRRIIKYYSFEGDLPKAVINAIVKVNPAGKGSFVGFGKGSTTRDARYAAAINRYLVNVAFDKSDSESTVTVVFNFNEQ